MDISSSCLSLDENKWFKDDDLGDGISGNFEVVDASKSPTIDVEDNDSPFQLLGDATHSDDVDIDSVDIDSECPLQFLSEFDHHISETKAPAQKKEKKRTRKKEMKVMEVNEVPGLAEDLHDEDDEMKKIRTRFKQGCDCEDSNCFQHLDPRSVYRHRLNITELTKAEHDMYLMGLIKACMSCNQTTKNKERQRLRSHYFYQGRKVCLTAFLFLENCTRYQLKAMRCHLTSHGVTPRVHGNQGKRPHNVFSLDTYNQASEFLKQFFEQTSPGSGYGRTPLTISLDHTTRKHIHALYTKRYTSSVADRLMGYSTFLWFMKHQFPHVKFVKQDSLSKISKEIIIRDKVTKQTPLCVESTKETPLPVESTKETPLSVESTSCTVIQMPNSNNQFNEAIPQYEIVVPRTSSQVGNKHELFEHIQTHDMFERAPTRQTLESQLDECDEIVESQVVDSHIIDQALLKSDASLVLSPANISVETEGQLVLSMEGAADNQFSSVHLNQACVMNTFALSNQPLLYIIQ